ncbi:MAG: hypothetical protein K2Q26_06790 [Bdellovibrionales bacterium]|nr:hypothetical protein [Bdellovibrionales bacterium]
MEQLVFKKQGVIDLSFSTEDDTRMFYAHRAITLRQRDFERYAVFPGVPHPQKIEGTSSERSHGYIGESL